MSVFSKFKTHIQTDDKHKQVSLRTHYYATSPSAILDYVSAETFRPSLKVRRIDKNRGELSFLFPEGDGLMTVIQIDGGRTAVDFTLNRESMLGSDLVELATNLYRELDEKFPLRAIGNEKVER